MSDSFARKPDGLLVFSLVWVNMLTWSRVTHTAHTLLKAKQIASHGKRMY